MSRLLVVLSLVCLPLSVLPERRVDSFECDVLNNVYLLNYSLHSLPASFLEHRAHARP